MEYALTIPAQAAAIPELRNALTQAAEAERTKLLAERKQQIAESNGRYTVPPYGLTDKWRVVADTAQLLVLVDEGYRYLGGAHGSDLFKAAIWDKQAKRQIGFADLFTDKASALATIRRSFCQTLNQKRAGRRGGWVDNGGLDAFNRCPDFADHITLAPAKTVGGKLARIGVWIPADIAGAHAEGSYQFDLVIPKEMIPLVRHEWRASFPTG